MEPTRNNRGVAHENGAIESPHGHLESAVTDALLMRGSGDFVDLATYRAFIDEIAARKNRRNAAGIDAERATLRPLLQLRTTLVTSQLPVARWHQTINDPTYADAILDRLVHNAHRLELEGESMRRPATPTAA